MRRLSRRNILIGVACAAALFAGSASPAAIRGDFSQKGLLRPCTTIVTTITQGTTTIVSTTVSTVTSTVHDTTTVTTTVTSPTTTTVPTTTTTPTTTTVPTTTTTPTTTGPPPPPPPPPPSCTKVMISGTVAAFESSLVPGDTGCIHAGVYGDENSTIGLSKSGTASARITLTSYPGETAILMGPTYVTGSYITFTGLTFDVSTHIRGVGGNCPAGRAETFQIAAHDDILDHVEITASDQANSSNGVYLNGSNNEVRYSKIHDVGACTDSTYGFDHGSYIGHGDGDKIHHNWIWNIHFGWGVQLYPDPTNSKVYSNVIDSARSGIIMCSSGANHEFYNNVVSNDTIGAMISGCGPTGANNTAHDNDAFNDPGGVGGSGAIVKTNNVSVDPLYSNRAAHDFRSLEPGLFAYGLWDGS